MPIVDTYEINSVKKSFNIVLNSTDTTSFNGTNTNAQYFIEFANVIPVQEMNRPYQVSVRFKSKVLTGALGTVADHIYLLQASFMNIARVQQNTGFNQIVSIISRYPEATQIQTTNNAYINYQFESYFPDNAPTFLDSLRDISQLLVKVTYEDMKTIATGFPDYVCILNFQQV